MKNFFGLAGILGFVLMATSGCGGSGNGTSDPNRPGNPAAYEDAQQANGPKNLCSKVFLADYNAVAVAAQNATTPDQEKQLKTQAQGLKTKYEGVKCAALDNGNQNITIDLSAKMTDLIAAIDRDLAAANPPGGRNPVAGIAVDSVL